MKKTSEYKLRKRIKELEEANSRFRSRCFKSEDIILKIFDNMCSCEGGQYYSPGKVLSWLRPLIIKRG